MREVTLHTTELLCALWGFDHHLAVVLTPGQRVLLMPRPLFMNQIKPSPLHSLCHKLLTQTSQLFCFKFSIFL